MFVNFTEESLPEAVRWLFETNGYQVEGPVHRHGAEIDLVATNRSGLGIVNTYIEVTVQRVDNTKYGKDLTKLEMFRNEPGAQRLIVSSKGFTPDVKERAAHAGILTFTYEELFRNFEKTEPYVQNILGSSTEFGLELQKLDEVYEEPLLVDSGKHYNAIDYLTNWRNGVSGENRWLVIVGEYGTGKTALTQVLLRRWTQEFARGYGVPLPFRIELRDFSRQFDARSLLHHFLDRNNLSHLAIDFVESMIANGRVILLLDGYDEMAQYLNIRERRACLEALADLARGGARGIMTSRPNYFTEAEELRVFEVLYKKLSINSFLPAIDQEVLAQERQVDSLLEGFVLHRQERQLNDLTPEQTRQLVERRLSADPAGAQIVIDILDQVFRAGVEEQQDVSLSGKPVIVSYLLEVVAELKAEPLSSQENGPLTEWQIFDLIVNKLMLRDYRRTPEMLPSERLKFLRSLAHFFADDHRKDINEDVFREFINRECVDIINRKRTGGEVDAAEALFDDLRSSSTLTRAVVRDKYHWQFSHNSLREFLVVEHLISAHLSGNMIKSKVPITDSMRLFARTMKKDRQESVVKMLADKWPSREANIGVSQILSLIWDGILALPDVNGPREAFMRVTGGTMDLNRTRLFNLNLGGALPTDLSKTRARESEFVETDFTNCTLDQSDFSGAVFDGCVFRNSRVRGANFSDVLLQDCDITDIDCHGADFSRIYDGSTALISVNHEITTLDGQELLGYLRYRGAKTDPVDPYYVYSYHRDFDIILKICRYLVEQTWRQRRGLEQRGSSERNIPLARRFVRFLLKTKLAQEKNGAPDLIGSTNEGRSLLSRFVDKKETPNILEEFMSEEFS